jgi:hypothetical protein
MAGSPTSQGSGDNTTPRWVKVFGVIAIIVLVAFVLLHLAGGGPRGH